MSSQPNDQTQHNQTTDMTDAEKRIIWELAQGDRRKREQAIAIHRKYLPTLGARGTPEQRYMAEVDHPAPDAGLKMQYREDMLRRRSVSDV